MRLFPLLAFAALLSGCGTGSDSGAGLDALNTRTVTLPNGKRIQAELMVNPVDQQRGMMFRDSLPADRGMLFVHPDESDYTYWMYQVKVPLDIVFMDRQSRVLGVSANTPPCRTKASECPKYGGYPGTKYVLELAAGEAARNGVAPGTTLSF